jgi:hypothetical protein
MSQDRLPFLSFSEETGRVRGNVLPKADLLRWKQLREAADLKIKDLRCHLASVLHLRVLILLTL